MVETIILKYLFDVITKEGESAVIDKIKSKFRSPAKDRETARALAAMKAAFTTFFKRYDDHFGPRKKSFLSWQENIQLMLDRIRLSRGPLEPGEFITTSEAEFPDVSTQALQFLIEAYEKELKKDRTLDDLLQTGRHIQQVNRIEEKVDKIAGMVQPTSTPTEAKQKISLSRLPNTGSAKLFGRAERMELLDQAWRDDAVKVVTLIAGGGVGKSCLVTHWLNKMAGHRYRGAKRLYGWSFYSQGSKEGTHTQVSADDFMEKSLQWFGDPEPTKGTGVEKARRLAELVNKEKTVLIMDGLEPMQHPCNLGHGLAGKVKDPGLRVFLKELAWHMNGLCIISSRQRVEDLNEGIGSRVKEVELEFLTGDAGIELLKFLGAEKGRDKDFRAAVTEMEGHALALTLLGNYIKIAHNGDIRKRDKITKLEGEPKQGEHARHVMQSYEKRLGESRERDILYLMGLFDRPAEQGAMAVLRAEPAIPGVTDNLKGLNGRPGHPEEEQWNIAVSNLREMKLLAEESGDGEGRLDCHPLVREYFGEQLQAKNRAGKEAAHLRLYDHYKGLPDKELPETLDEMEPLFAAIAHGCRAGKLQETFEDVYFKRILRRNEKYLWKKLGAFGSDLAALSHFFHTPWQRPSPQLTEPDQAAVLGWSAFGLRALGRLQEALEPMKAGLDMRRRQENWKEVALESGNLSQLLLTLGRVAEAKQYGRQATEAADRIGDDFMKEARRTDYADALHQGGEPGSAEALFREAEEMQKKRQPQYPYLYSLWGYRFCDLLLAHGRVKEVRQRAEKSLEIAIEENWLLDIALDRLTLGRALMQDSNSEARQWLDEAVQGLRKSGAQHHIPRALLARTAWFRLQKQYAPAAIDLKEVLEIAQSGGMKLFLVDYHLESGRLCRARGEISKAKEHFAETKRLIEETGYERRRKEINCEL